MSIDADGRLLHANQAVLDALRHHARGADRPAAVRTSSSPTARDEFRIALHAKSSPPASRRSIETVFVTSTGKRINVEGSVHPKVIDGRAVLARVIFRDITERKEFEAELGTRATRRWRRRG